MYMECKVCNYVTEECKRNREINQKITQDGGKWAIYMCKNNVCPSCHKLDTLVMRYEKRE